jgi:hypothetical protein
MRRVGALYFDAPLEPAPSPLAWLLPFAPLLLPAGPAISPGEQAMPVTLSLPFTQFLLLREERGDGVAGVAGVAAFALRRVSFAAPSLLATFFDFFSLSVDAVVSVPPFVEPAIAVVLPLGVVLLAEEVVSVVADPAPLTVPDVGVFAGTVAVLLSLAFFSLCRSPMASALVLARAKTEIKNTGASLRIRFSFRSGGLGGEAATPRSNCRARAWARIARVNAAGGAFLASAARRSAKKNRRVARRFRDAATADPGSAAIRIERGAVPAIRHAVAVGVAPAAARVIPAAIR